MAFDPDAYLAGKPQAASQGFDPDAYAAGRVDAKDNSPPAQTATGRATTTATTPEEAKRETQDSEKEKLRSDLAADSAKAFGYGVARGGTLGTVDRLVGIGTQAGESLASLTSGTTEDAEAGSKARSEYLAKESEAAKDAPISNLVGNVGGSIIPTVATMGAVSPAAGRTLAAASGVESAIPATRVAAQGLGRLAASPEARMAGQNFVAGTMNEPSDDMGEQARAGLGAVAFGAAAGKAGEATLGKTLRGATDREARGLVRDIMRNEGTDIAATPTARRRFMERADAAVQEVRANKELASAIRSGDAAHASNIAKSKLQVISEPREGMYRELDSHSVLGIDHLDAVIRKAERTATGAEKRALESFRAELQNDWIPKWQAEGRLITRQGKPLGVSNLGVREWVTSAQSAASTVIGTIDEGARKQVKDSLEDVAEDIWKKHLGSVSHDNPALVKNIRDYDRRASGLIALGKIMDQRAVKDQEGLLGFTKKHATGINASMLGGASVAASLGHPGTALMGLGTYAAARKAPNVARFLNDRILVPLQKAAESGVPLADAMVYASEKGIPAGIVRSVYAGAVNVRDLAASTVEGIRGAVDIAREAAK